ELVAQAGPMRVVFDLAEPLVGERFGTGHAAVLSVSVALLEHKSRASVWRWRVSSSSGSGRPAWADGVCAAQRAPITYRRTRSVDPQATRAHTSGRAGGRRAVIRPSRSEAAAPAGRPVRRAAAPCPCRAARRRR